jgi:tripartite-type tricarboxylate transporter receptor subunit TctC
VKGKFAKIGVRPGSLGAEAYTALVRSELTRWREIITAANIRAD